MSTLTLNLSEKLVQEIIKNNASLRAEIEASVIDRAAKSYLTKGIEKRVERLIKDDLSNAVDEVLSNFINGEAYGYNEYSSIKAALYNRIKPLVEKEIENRIKQCVETYAEDKIKELVDAVLNKDNIRILAHIERVIDFKISTIVTGLMQSKGIAEEGIPVTKA